MSLLGDIKSGKAIVFKGFLFLLLIAISVAALLEQNPNMRTFFLVAVLIWSSARFYYFLFHVIENYVDGEFKYSGLVSLIRYAMKTGNRKNDG